MHIGQLFAILENRNSKKIEKPNRVMRKTKIKAIFFIDKAEEVPVITSSDAEALRILRNNYQELKLGFISQASMKQTISVVNGFFYQLSPGFVFTDVKDVVFRLSLFFESGVFSFGEVMCVSSYPSGVADSRKAGTIPVGIVKVSDPKFGEAVVDAMKKEFVRHTISEISELVILLNQHRYRQT